MIVTLAGHVDHGKTSLVKALTGVDTDRLEEEKKRGLTIDLGFAYHKDLGLGFVDVPGHQKFVHNMVAGVAQDQAALLVVAADDGPMPQTQEHLDIMSIIGLKRGIIALTKCDRVDAEQVDRTEQRIRALTAGSFLENAPIFQTSAFDPLTIEPLQKALAAMTSDAEQDQQPFRLAIDRRFVIKGAGTVVTGTVHAGTLSVDQTVYHSGTGRELRVRSLRAQDTEVATVQQGDRSAINLSGIDAEEIERGDWLQARPPEPVKEVTIELNVLGNFPRQVKHWTPVHIYHATAHTTGHLALLASGRLEPGSQHLVDVVCDEPLYTYHGDQLVIRDYGLDTTLGGGRVVHSGEHVSPRRRNPERLETLSAHQLDTAEATLAQLLDNGPLKSTDFARNWQLSDDQYSTLLKEHKALKLGDYTLAQKELGQLAKQALDKATQHFDANPDSTGLKENEFDLDPRFRSQVLGALAQTGKLKVVNGNYQLPQHQAALPEALQARWQKLQSALNATQPPSSGDLAKLWQVPQRELEADLKELGKRGYVIFVAEHRHYLPEKLQELAELVRKLAAKAPFTVREFRDASGMGRNVAIEVLEHFDRRGFTRREENHRKVMRETL